MSARRPSLEQVLLALDLHAVDPDLAEALQLTVEAHTPGQANADRHGRYGRCGGCQRWWPCPPWLAAREAAVLGVWEESQRRWVHAQQVWAEHLAKSRAVAA